MESACNLPVSNAVNFLTLSGGPCARDPTIRFRHPARLASLTKQAP